MPPKSADKAGGFSSTRPYDTSKHSFKQPRGSAAAAVASRFGPAPPGETPKEKVARLRAIVQQQRNDVPRLEKVINYGRKIADRAHRTFVLSFLTISALGGTYVAFSTANMIFWNRRKRKEWAREKDMAKARVMLEAQAAARAGLADDDQILMLAQQREAMIKEKERMDKAASKKSLSWVIKDMLFRGMNDEDRAARVASRARINAMVQQMTEEQERLQNTSNEPVEAPGGFLDRLGRNASSTIGKGVFGLVGRS